MAQERYRRRTNTFSDEFDTTLMYDDIEKIREMEEEEEKDQHGKLGSAGMMALIAGATVLAGTLLSQVIPMPEIITQITQVIVPAIGFGAMAYGFIKMINLAFRRKELNFPALNVYRKTKTPPPGAEKTRTNGRQAQARERYQRTRTRPYQTTASTSNRKTVRRSRSNRVFSGVAGGIAEYTNISVTLIRFAFIIGLFMFFPMSVFVYLLLSIVLPANFEPYEDGNPSSPNRENITIN